VRGLQHRAAFEPRQDAFALRLAGTDELIAVVCDGVGSLPRSHEAAEFVARRLAHLACAGTAWTPAFTTVNDELNLVARACEATDGTPLAMATTALALRVKCDGPGWHGQAAWVGDSSLWHLDAGGSWSRCTAPEPDDQVEGVHCTSSTALPAAPLRVGELELHCDDGALFLMSDGVGNPLAWVDEVRATFAKWWAAPPELFDFGRQVGFARQSHVDDRTAVGLWLRS
jgi:hypothetical protein